VRCNGLSISTSLQRIRDTSSINAGALFDALLLRLRRDTETIDIDTEPPKRPPMPGCQPQDRDSCAPNQAVGVNDAATSSSAAPMAGAAAGGQVVAADGMEGPDCGTALKEMRQEFGHCGAGANGDILASGMLRDGSRNGLFQVIRWGQDSSEVDGLAHACWRRLLFCADSDGDGLDLTAPFYFWLSMRFVSYPMEMRGRDDSDRWVLPRARAAIVSDAWDMLSVGPDELWRAAWRADLLDAFRRQTRYSREIKHIIGAALRDHLPGHRVLAPTVVAFLLVPHAHPERIPKSAIGNTESL
jgi:hypothetical protein